MTARDNEATFRRLIVQGFGEGNLSVVDEVMAPGMVEHQRGMLPPNPEGVKRAITSLHAAFSDMHYTFEHMVAQDDTVWAHMKARGTHTGSLMGLPPTGKTIEIDVIDICRFENGRIVEHWGVPDRLGMLEQLGALPQPSQRSR